MIYKLYIRKNNIWDGRYLKIDIHDTKDQCLSYKVSEVANLQEEVGGVVEEPENTSSASSHISAGEQGADQKTKRDTGYRVCD